MSRVSGRISEGIDLKFPLTVESDTNLVRDAYGANITTQVGLISLEDGGHQLDWIRKTELASIRQFVTEEKDRMKTGRVLDFGCGKPGTCRKPSPYRDLIAGEYVGFDKGDPIPSGYFNTILCTQVIQYTMYGVYRFLMNFKLLFPLSCAGTLIMTGPTNWPVVEDDDRYRLTCKGLCDELRRADYDVVRVVNRANVRVGRDLWPLGWGVVATTKGTVRIGVTDES